MLLPVVETFFLYFGGHDCHVVLVAFYFRNITFLIYAEYSVCGFHCLTEEKKNHSKILLANFRSSPSTRGRYNLRIDEMPFGQRFCSQSGFNCFPVSNSIKSFCAPATGAAMQLGWEASVGGATAPIKERHECKRTKCASVEIKWKSSLSAAVHEAHLSSDAPNN